MRKSKILLLIGGGHAHMYFMKKYAKQKIDNFDVILISADNKQYYSGMASAFMEGIYNEGNFSFDLPNTCKVSGIEFILGTVEKIDPNNKTISLSISKKSNCNASLMISGSSFPDSFEETTRMGIYS